MLPNVLLNFLWEFSPLGTQNTIIIQKIATSILPCICTSAKDEVSKFKYSNFSCVENRKYA